MGHYHRSTTDHKDKWRRRQGLTAGGVALALLWTMVAMIGFAADWEVPSRALPWAQLDIDDRIGLFTRGKLNRSTGAQCRMILGNGGVTYTDVTCSAGHCRAGKDPANWAMDGCLGHGFDCILFARSGSILVSYNIVDQ